MQFSEQATDKHHKPSDHPVSLKRETLRKKIVRRLDRHFGGTRLGCLTRIETEQHAAALTFDDGPHPENTPKILEILAAYNAKATFFMLGMQAAKYPELVEQVSQAGHAIGNHSWDHQSFPHQSGRQRRSSIRACHRALGGYASNLIRPPFGDQDLFCRLDTLFFGLEMVLWDIPADDWLDHSGEEIFEIVQKKLRPGSIVLMHDRLEVAEKVSYAGRNATLTGLERLMAANPNYNFLTIPQLLRMGTPVRRFQPQTANHANLMNLVRLDD